MRFAVILFQCLLTRVDVDDFVALPVLGPFFQASRIANFRRLASMNGTDSPQCQHTPPGQVHLVRTKHYFLSPDLINWKHKVTSSNDPSSALLTIYEQCLTRALNVLYMTDRRRLQELKAQGASISISPGGLEA